MNQIRLQSEHRLKPQLTLTAFLAFFKCLEEMCVCKCVCDSINICIQLFMFIDTILHAFYSSLHSGDKTLRDLLFFLLSIYLIDYFFLSFNAQVSQLVGSFELLCAAPNTMHP